LSSRYIDFQTSTSTPTTYALANNDVRVYVKSDSLWGFNDNSADVNLMRPNNISYTTLNADSIGWLANRELEMPAAAFLGTPANGATDGIVGYLSIKNFDTATAETMTVDIVLPKYWSSIDSIQIDAGTADTAGDSVSYAVQWYGAAANAAAGGTFSTAVRDTIDMGTSADFRKILSYTSTIAGTGLAPNARVTWKVWRDPSIAHDVAADVYIRGMRLFGKG
jgi:hypothetical protein